MNRILIPLFAAAVIFAAGCEDDDYDHVPPKDKGSLAIENHTDDLEVYIDGQFLDDVNDYDNEVFDLTPGTYRLTLTQDHGDRYYSGFIDILDGRVTVVDVNTGYDADEYNIDIEYD